MKRPYKPVPGHAVIARGKRLGDGAEVQLFTGPGNGTTGYYGAYWGVTVSLAMTNGTTLVLSTRDFPWTEAGETLARAEYGKLTGAVDLRAPCVGCGLPRGAHTAEALTACEVVS